MLPSHINGCEKLLAIFGEWPSFHDAEVMSLVMERQGPLITLRLFTFKTTDETDDQGLYRRINKCIVTLRFNDVADIAIQGFNHQNVVAGIAITNREDSRIQVSIDSLFGLEGAFSCASANVDDIEPLSER